MICRHHTVATPLRGAQSSRLVSAPLRCRLGQQHLPCVSPRRVKQPTINASGGNTDPSTEQKPHPGSASARHLLSVSALAFFSFVAILAKDRVINPIVPPLIPPVASLTSAPTPSSVIQPGSAATATAERPDVEPFDILRAPVKRSKSLLRTLWGTATLPVKLVDALLFPEEPLVGSTPSKQASATYSTTAEPAPAHTLTTASSDGPSAALPAADPAAAAAGEALSAVAKQIDALAASAAAELPAAPASRSTAPGDFLLQLQDAVRRLAKQQQDAVGSSSTAEAAGSSASTAAAADTAAALAALRVLLGADVMSLLPVVLVTAATAAAGLLLAASIAGVAGLMNGRAAATPAQRAAEAALFDSPLRPISCPTWPGFLPMLPASLEPTFYRKRDTTPAAAEVSTDDVAADVVYSNSSKAQAAPVTVQPSSSSAATQVATTVTALAMLGVFVAPGAAGLLPVVLVTSGSAAAGLLLAASIAGVAGLVDKRRVLTPAQRAAEAALLDSPLRPISCPTMPGILPSLPASMEPIFYRWRESEPAASTAGSTESTPADTDSTTSTDSPAKASSAGHTVRTAGSPAKEHPLDQEWWSFAQIQALRLMPLLSQGSRSSGKAGAGAGSVTSKAVAADSPSAAQVAVQDAAAPQAAVAAAPQTDVKDVAAAGAADSTPPAQVAAQGAAAGPQVAAPAVCVTEIKDAAAGGVADCGSAEHAMADTQAAAAGVTLAEAQDTAGVADGSAPAQPAEQGAAADTQAAAPSALQTEAEDAAAAACKRFMHCWQRAATRTAAESVQTALKMLDGLQDAGPAWEVALAAVAASYTCFPHEFAAMSQEFGSTAPARLLAEVCALLPAAAVNYFDAAAAAAGAAGARKRQERCNDYMGWSWGNAERLLAALLQPAGGPDRVRQVCGEMGLYWEGGKDDDHAVSGVLQYWAEQSKQAASKLEPVSKASWGPEGGFVEEWVTAQHKQSSRAVDVALRSCCMASHMAMELWFAQGCGPLVGEDSGSQHGPQPAVLFSHYELLQLLQDSSSRTPDLCKVILQASAWMACPENRNDDPASSDHWIWPEDEDGGGPYTWWDRYGHDSTETRAVLQLVIRNGSSKSLFKGKFPPVEDAKAWSSIRQSLVQAQEACPRLLAATAGSGAAAADMSEQRAVEAVVEALLCGKHVMSVPTLERLRMLHSVAGAEWVAAGQLVQLYMVLPRSTATAVLQRFAAAVDIKCLARVCALLPAAGQNYGIHSRPSAYYEGPVDYQQDLLQVLAAGVAAAADSAPAATAALLSYMGIRPEAAAAAAAAASSGAAGSSWERVDAALAAAKASGGWGVGSGLLQELHSSYGDCSKDEEAAREIGTCSILAAAAALLDSNPAVAADAVVELPSRAVMGVTLWWGDWGKLVAKFVEMSMEDTPGRAAMAGLLAHGLLSPLSKGQGPQPAAFRNSVLQTLSRCGPGSLNYRGDWEYSYSALAVVSRWSDPLPCTDAVTAHPLPLTHRGGQTAAAAAESGADAAAEAKAARDCFYTSAEAMAAAAGSGADAAAEGKAASEGSCSREEELRVEIDWAEAEAPSGGYMSGAGAHPGDYMSEVPVEWELGSKSAFNSSEADVGVKIEWPEAQVPSCAEIKGLGWANGWGVAGEEGGAGSRDGRDSSKKKQKRKQQKQNQQKPTNQQGQGPQGSRKHVVAAALATASPPSSATKQPVQQQQQGKTPPRARSRSTSSKSPKSTATARPKADLFDDEALRWEPEADALMDEVFGEPVFSARVTDGEFEAAHQAELVPTVKKLLGLPVDASRSGGSYDLVPNRLTLLLCQGMVMRGEESQAKLQSAVAYLAFQQSAKSLTHMLAGCMEALFTTEDWESPTGSARQVLSTLSGALEPHSYRLLQQELKAKGLIKKVEK